MSHVVPSDSDSKKRRNIPGEVSHKKYWMSMRCDANRGKKDAKFTTKANKVRINWGAAGRGDNGKKMRRWLNVEEGGSTIKETVGRYLPAGIGRAGYHCCTVVGQVGHGLVLRVVMLKLNVVQ